MTEEPVNEHNSEKSANNNEQFKRSTQYKTFNRRDLIRNQKNNFRHRNNCSNFNKRFQNNFDRRKHFENQNPLRRLRKQPLKIQVNEEHQNIPENIPEDSLVAILTAIHSRTSSRETIIVTETQQTDESFFITKPTSLETGSKKENSKNENKTKKMENKNHSKKKQQQKNLLKQKNNYKQIKEEKKVKSQQEIVLPKLFNLSKKTLSRYKLIFYYALQIHTYTKRQYNSTKVRYS